MPAGRLVIVDGGGANIASLRYALARLGHEAELTTDAARIRDARHVILPGVGAAAAAMERLGDSGLAEVLPTLSQPVLGICLGLQLLFTGSEEDDAACLGIIPGNARRFAGSPDLPVPHMGWNSVQIDRKVPLLDGIPDGSYFYFVHSYAVDPGPAVVATSEYGRRFAAVVAEGNFLATQFHPERSGEHGARILANFLGRY